MKKIFFFLFMAVFLFACGSKKLVRQEGVFYTCSMDPQVVSDKPGNCPICGMPLTPVKKSAVDNTDDIELSDQQIQLGNIRVDTITMGNIQNSMELTGILNVNASQMASVSARVMGRIEKLYVKTTGDFVSRGSPLYELYSEELNNAKQEYIAALQRKPLFTDQSLIDFEDLLESARTKLRLWGMTESQIRALENQKQAPLTTTFYSTESGYVTSLDVTEGGYVMEGKTILQLANLSTLWVEIQVYSSQLHQVPRGASASVYIPALDREVNGRIEFSNPEVSVDTRINLHRIQVANAGNELKPGMSAVVKVKTASRNSLALPTDAVIRDAMGATVWLQTGKNKFKSRMVTTGLESEGVIEITSGLKEGDLVVFRGTYLLHSEFVFKRGADPMGTHNH
jgi:Cu(I)/Ag(I) efflux system membrane fusion protein